MALCSVPQAVLLPSSRAATPPDAIINFAGVYPVISAALVQTASCLQKALADLPDKTAFNLGTPTSEALEGFDVHSEPMNVRATGHQWNHAEEAHEEAWRKLQVIADCFGALFADTRMLILEG